MRARWGWFSGEVGEDLGHAGGEPAVAAAPEEGDVFGVVEEAVGLLKAVEVGDHFFGVAVEVLLVSGGAIGLELQHGEHVHVVDPEAGLGGKAVGLGILPLAVGPADTFLEKLGVFGLDGDLEGNDAEDGVVDVVAEGDAGLIVAAGHHRLEAGDEALAEVVVVGELGVGERAIPGTDLGVVERRGVLVGAGDEVLGEAFADLLGGGSGGPVVEVGGLAAGLGKGGGRKEGGGEEGGEDGFHAGSFLVGRRLDGQTKG